MSPAEEFKIKGFTIVRNAVDITDLWPYVQSKINDICDPDPEIPDSPSFYRDVEMNKVQHNLHSLIESTTGKELYPTYNYFRLYKNKSELMRHVDRPACEVSVSLCVGFKGNNWNLWIKDLSNGKETESILEPGDMLVYQGCEAEHWRKIYDGELHCNVFIHFVDKNGPNKNCIYDMLR